MKLLCSSQKLEGMEKDFSGSQGTQQNVVREKKNKKKRNKYYLSESNLSRTHYR